MQHLHRQQRSVCTNNEALGCHGLSLSAADVRVGISVGVHVSMSSMETAAVLCIVGSRGHLGWM